MEFHRVGLGRPFELGIACSNAMRGAKAPDQLPSSGSKSDAGASAARNIIFTKEFPAQMRGLARRLTHVSASQ